jgi:cell division protein FtsN
MTVDRTAARRGGLGLVGGVLLAGAAIGMLALSFGLGVLVGRGSGRPGPAAAAPDAEGTERRGPAPRRSALVEPAAQKPAGPAGRLTFYETLVAPAPAPAAAPDRGRERPAPEAGRAAAPRPSAPAPGAAPPPGGAAPAAPAPSATSPPAPGAWSVQVGAFRTREQAEAMQRRLGQAGLAALVSPREAEGGGSRFRVRVGSFRTRSEAERAAERLRAEQALPTYVTTSE